MKAGRSLASRKAGGGPSRRWLRSLAAALLVLAVTAGVVQLVRAGQEKQVASVVDTYARVFTARLEERLQARFLVADLIRGELETGGGFHEAMFLAAAGTVHAQLGDLQALNWVDPDGVIRIVTPSAGNEAALGLDIAALPEPGRTLRAADAQDRLRITPPINLAQGGRGFVAYLPVRGGTELLGFVNLVFKAAPLVADAMEDESQRSFRVAIYDGMEPIHVEEADAPSLRHATINRIDVGGRNWSVMVSPSSFEIARAQSILDECMLLIGLLTAIGAAVLLNESERSKATLRDREERFALAMKGASDGLFDWNPVTGETYFSPRWYELLGYAEGELPAAFDTFSQMLHPEDRQRIVADPKIFAAGDAEHIENEFRLRHRDGSWRTILSRAFAVRKGGRVVRVVGTHIDITERNERQRALEHAARTDELTGLLNRRGMRAALSQLAADLTPGESLAIFHLDLDKFKAINDTSGHEAGDAALVVTAGRLRSCAGGFDFVARIGGDEFLLARKVPAGTGEIARIAEDLIVSVSRPFSAKGCVHRVGASIGVSVLTTPGNEGLNQAVSNSDIALNAAKSLGRGCFVFYDEAMRDAASHDAKTTRATAAAADKGEVRALS